MSMDNERLVFPRSAILSTTTYSSSISVLPTDERSNHAAATRPSSPTTQVVSTSAPTPPTASEPKASTNKLRTMLSMHALTFAQSRLEKGSKKSSADPSNSTAILPFTKKSSRYLKALFNHESSSKSSRNASWKTRRASSSSASSSSSSGHRAGAGASSIISSRKSSSDAAHNDYVAIKPRIPGAFVPSLPPELWLLILRYATYPPFVSHTESSSTSSNNNTSTPYPYPYPYPTASSSSTFSSSSTPVSFLAHPPAHTHLSERLAQYTADIQWKASLTRVCRVWNWVGQEVLYEFVWIARGREARWLAGRLCADGGGVLGGGVVGGVTQASVGMVADGNGWMSRRGPSSSFSQSPTPPPTLKPKKSVTGASTASSVGRFIRRLHIETRSMERCSPHDLLLILQHCPLLEWYSDYRSVRRPMHPLMLSLSPVVPFSVVGGLEEGLVFSGKGKARAGEDDSDEDEDEDRGSGHQENHYQVLLTPDALLHTLLSHPLKRLSWTNYEYDGSNFQRGVRFYEDVVRPRLAAVGQDLEFLEVVLSGASAHGMGGREEGGWGVGGGGVGRDRVVDCGECPEVSIGKGLGPAMRMYGAANMLTELEASYTTTRSFVSSGLFGASSSSSLSSSCTPQMEPSVDGFTYTLLLPSLRSLKVTLDNATFFVLSTWDMPLLTHLSVLSADFGYAAGGFRRFFEVHGTKILQLELGHSSGDIEEAWVTDPPGRFAQHDADTDDFKIPLNAWCPNLREFICSADAEWNWQSPDWIAPHVLLPTHAGLQFIGVRDMERRLIGDMDDALRRRRQVLHSADADGREEEDEDADDPYFMLLEQFGSLLRKEAFPSLLYVRDMSWESDVIRRTGRMASSSSPPPPPPPPPQPIEALHPSFSNWGFASSSSHMNNATNWWLTPASWSTTPGQKKLVSQAQLAARQAEEALARSQGRKVLRFWSAVLEKCRERGVWLEDCHGVNVTAGDLRRAAV